MNNEEWEVYRRNTEIMTTLLEDFISFLVKRKTNMKLTRSGNASMGRLFSVEIFTESDVELYLEDISVRKDLIKYFSKLGKLIITQQNDKVINTYILDAGFGLVTYEIIHPVKINYVNL